MLTPHMLMYIIFLCAAVVGCSVFFDVHFSQEAIEARRSRRDQNVWLQRGEKLHYKAKLQRNRHRKSY